MNEDKLSRKWLCGYALGLIPVFWLALLIAPYMDGGLPKLIANADVAFADPFAIRWCEDTPRTILILSMIYMVCIGMNWVYTVLLEPKCFPYQTEGGVKLPRKKKRKERNHVQENQTASEAV